LATKSHIAITRDFSTGNGSDGLGAKTYASFLSACSDQKLRAGMWKNMDSLAAIA
jgi:hypothetical protein